jgi:hypothetical protein
MEATLEAVISLLIEKGGIWAVPVTILMFAVWRLFGLLMLSQEKRIEEKGAATTAISENARALERLTELLQAGRRRS